jgi:hypothetical protein
MTREGEWIRPKEIMEHFEGILGLRDYELVQKGFEIVDVRLRSDDASDQIIRAIESYLDQILGEKTRVRVEAWDNENMPLKLRPVRREPSLS